MQAAACDGKRHAIIPPLEKKRLFRALQDRQRPPAGNRTGSASLSAAVFPKILDAQSSV